MHFHFHLIYLLLFFLLQITETVSVLYEIGKIFYPVAKNREWLSLGYFITSMWLRANTPPHRYALSFHDFNEWFWLFVSF